MGFGQPEGRIVINTGAGRCDKVNPEKVIGYGFIDDDEIRKYDVDGMVVKINRYKKCIDELSKVEF